MTNYEKIKAMSVEEMAKAFNPYLECGGLPVCADCKSFRECEGRTKEFLLQEAEE